MERFLSLCAENNLQTANATTPAQQFHVLRRQLKRDFRKPLICFTPKKLLRYPSCVSKIEDFTSGGFQEILDDNGVDAKNIKRIGFCSGKIYYDLIERREKEGVNDIAFVRVEQIYPVPSIQLEAIKAKYKNAKEYLWIQEEPENNGAWSFVHRMYKGFNFTYVGRDEAASPATGYAKKHAEETEEILSKIFAKVLVK